MALAAPAFTENTRWQALDSLRRGGCDVLILGGGINGAGVARDLALRARIAGHPLRVALVERNHFASGTSGKNSQLIHGGLRYLKNLEFRLVREALRERATLLEIAPHMVKPLRFLIPMYSHFAAVFYGTGLWLYDVLAGSKNVARHRQLSAQDVHALEPSLDAAELVSGALFTDCQVHSARFVLENLFDAAGNGALIANYTHAGAPRRVDGMWHVSLQDRLSGETFETRARKIVDTRGPWGDSGEAELRLVRGSHLVLKRVTAAGNAIAFFEEQGRIIFLIPWGERRDLTLVGTTDVDHEGTADDVHISRQEAEYLLGIVRRLYPGADTTVLAAYSSLRPLLRDEGSSATSTSREHRIWNSAAGIVHVAGGKYTTYRLMSEEAGDLVAREIAPELSGIHLTAATPLAGNARDVVAHLRQGHPEIAAVVDDYGAHLPDVLAKAPDMTAARIRFAAQHEMALHLIDLLFVSTYWGYEQRWDEASLWPVAEELGRCLGWTADRCQSELREALAKCRRALPPPS